jgi:hypothetical protein
LDVCDDTAVSAGCCIHTNICGCGNGILDAGEECDGPANEACGGGFCQADCTCGREIPTISHWGLAILAMLLLIGAKVRFSQRRSA